MMVLVMTELKMMLLMTTVLEIMIRPMPSIVILRHLVRLWRPNLNRKAAGIAAYTVLVEMDPPAQELNSVPIVASMDHVIIAPVTATTASHAEMENLASIVIPRAEMVPRAGSGTVFCRLSRSNETLPNGSHFLLASASFVLR